MARNFLEKSFDYSNPFYYMESPSISKLKGSGGFYSTLSGRPQARAARDAGKIQEKSQREALDFQKEMYQQGRADQAPWLESGRRNLGTLNDMLAQGRFDTSDQEIADANMPDYNFDQGGQFDAGKYQMQQVGKFDPSNIKMDPGYDFRMKQGQQALERGANARLGLMSGGALKGALEYGQNLASGEYNNAYNRALNTYDTNKQSILENNRITSGNRDFAYGQFGDEYNKRLNNYDTSYSRNATNKANMFNRRVANRADLYNRYSGLAGQGQQVASQLAGQGNTYGQQQGQGMREIGDTRGNSLINQQNAKSQAFQNNLNNLLQLGQMGAKAYGMG